MSKEVYNAFIVEVSNDEIFREELLANPKEVLDAWDLSEEELDSIKHGEAWAWLRALWHAPPGW